MQTLVPLFGAVVLGAWTAPPTAAPAPLHDYRVPVVVEVRMVDAGGGQWRFEPATIDVHPGDVVRFVQDDVAPHNVQFKDVPSGSDLGAAVMGPFLLQKGETYELAIDERFAFGDHAYVCTPHEPLGMVGTINVVAEGSVNDRQEMNR